MSLKMKNDHTYESSYDSSLLRGIDDPQTPRPWDLFNEIKKYSSTEKILLDIGCGTAFKLLPLSPYLKRILGLDISNSMLFAAKRKIENNNIENMQLIMADSEKIPIAPRSIDLITSMLGRWNLKEFATALKSNGIVIIEHIGCEDKKDFKKLFGRDEIGWRGQYIEYERDEYMASCYQHFHSYFKFVSIVNSYWNTYYTTQGLKLLLANTPTIRNYNEKYDEKFLNLAIKKFSRKNGVKLIQNRMLIHATNNSELQISNSS